MSDTPNDGLEYWPKFRHIVPVYLTVGLVSGALPLAVRWCLSTWFPGFEIKETVWLFWVPAIFPALPFVIWLWPRFKILRYEKRTSDRRFTLAMIAYASMAIPAMIAQHYVFQAIAELHEVETVFDIDPASADRYYRIADYEVATQLGAFHADVNAVGRGRKDLRFKFYYAAPVVDPQGAPSHDHAYWYGMTHSKFVSNRLSAEEKRREFEKALKDFEKILQQHDFKRQEYFEVVQPSDDRDHYRRAVEEGADIGREDGAVILVPGDGAFQHRTGDQLGWILLSSAGGFVVFLLFLMWPGYDVQELERQRGGRMPKADPTSGFMEFFIPRNDFFAAPILLNTIILVYLVMILSGVHPLYPKGLELLEWGANRRAETTGGEWWRLLSSMFLHGGPMHLAMNVFGLLLAAVFVEPIYGRWKLFVIYFVAGICGSLASIWWYENTISAGASGAIFGLFGAVFALACMRVLDFRSLSWLWMYIAVGLLFGLTGGVDNAAHLGGLVSGMIVGALLKLFTTLRYETLDPP